MLYKYTHNMHYADALHIVCNATESIELNFAEIKCFMLKFAHVYKHSIIIYLVSFFGFLVRNASNSH